MLQTITHLNLIMMMNNHQLSTELIKDFTFEKILSCCERIGINKVLPSSYENCTAIQKELIHDEKFADYIKKLTASKISKTNIEQFLNELHSRKETALDYPAERLISSMAVTSGHFEIFYDYLRYFSVLPTNKEQKQYIVQNLIIYRKGSSIPIADLPEVERNLFIEPFLCKTYLIPTESINRSFTMLTQQSALKELLQFFYDNRLNVYLNIDDYDKLSPAAELILVKLKEIYKLFDRNNKMMTNLLECWIENNCPLFDLDTLSTKLKNLDEEQKENIFRMRSSYINFIYGSKIKSIPFAEIGSYQEDILIYAITNKKFSFLRLIENNMELFYEIYQDSILYNRNFYAKNININSLTVKNLKECKKMKATEMKFDELDKIRSYTFEEIKALYGQPAQYIKLYNRLNVARIDNRLIILRQLTGHKLLAAITEESHIDRLADKLSMQPLSVWRENEFAHIAGLSAVEAVELLIYHTEIKKFIPQLKTRTDAKIVLKNWDIVQNYNTLNDLKGGIVEIDNTWRKLVQKMELNEQFLRQNQERVIEFLCQNGAYIANTYYDHFSDSTKKESFKRIIKAELMGEFQTLKYYADDLQKEIDYPINAAQKLFWAENTELLKDSIRVKECDDFYSTMLMGTTPQRTCLSYIDGQYKECLLSNFDSNKKVLYAYMNGKIVGRAIIRFTKGRYTNIEEKETSSLSFIDVEKLQDTADAQNNKTKKEYPIIFLEKLYTSGISSETENLVMNSFIDLAERKAIQMGVMLVLSSKYGAISKPGYTKTLFYVYISKSKAGTQYLDSLNGAATLSDEGGYRVNDFYIGQKDLLRK